jgi:transcriptional regulator with XRE-family HTH domain
MSKQRPMLQTALGQTLREFREGRGWSQDRFAKRARECGLNWTRSALAKVERGEREVRLAEFLLLPAVLGVALQALIPGELDSWIQLTPTAAASTEALRRELKGQVLKDSSVDFDLPHHRRSRHAPASPAEKKRLQTRVTLLKDIAPDLDFGTFYKALNVVNSAAADAERKAARALSKRLSREIPAEHLVLLAFRKWDGRTLSEERERILAERKPGAAGDARDKAAQRGWITRRLVGELEQELALAPIGVERRKR